MVKLGNNKSVSIVLTSGNYSTVISAMPDQQEDVILSDTTTHDGIASPAIAWLKTNTEDAFTQLRNIPCFSGKH